MSSVTARALPRLLIVSLDDAGERMAGLTIRYAELARALRPFADVTLAAPQGEGAPPHDLTLLPFRPHAPAALRQAIRDADAILTHPQWPVLTRWIERSGARTIYDLYDPEALETLELFAGRRPLVRRTMVGLAVDRLVDALTTGHHFICASEKQRDLWLGAMMAHRLLDADRYDADPTLRSVIDVVPYGVAPEPPRRNPARPSLRDRFPTIGAEDEVIVWNGGVWGWLDAPTAIRAVGLLAKRRPQVRLVFMGATTNVAGQAATEEAQATAAAEGLLDRIVFFNDDWVPYEERANWLLDAHCALSTHRDHLETRFAFRTRLLDCFWAGLPVVCTSGDDLSDRVDRDALGAVCAAGSAADAAGALERVLERGRGAYGPALAAASAEFAWERVAAPLVRWLGNAGPAGCRPRARRSPGHATRALAYTLGHRALDLRSRR